MRIKCLVLFEMIISVKRHFQVFELKFLSSMFSHRNKQTMLLVNGKYQWKSSKYYCVDVDGGRSKDKVVILMLIKYENSQKITGIHIYHCLLSDRFFRLLNSRFGFNLKCRIKHHQEIHLNLKLVMLQLVRITLFICKW